MTTARIFQGRSYDSTHGAGERGSVPPGKLTRTAHLAPRARDQVPPPAASDYAFYPALPAVQASAAREDQPAGDDPFGLHLEDDAADHDQPVAGDPAPVQRSAGDAAAGAIHDHAARGMQGPSEPLPHLDRIQPSFGRHDVRHVQAHVGGEARGAAEAIGAHGYASGNHVVFARAPELHLAAHEAAHVVQQRAGVQLSGGVGRVGDRYEQHADAVADRVARGESAEALLDEMAGGGGGAAGVQRKAPGEGGSTASRLAAYARGQGIGVGTPDAIARQLRLAFVVREADGIRGFGPKLVRYVLTTLSSDTVWEIARITYQKAPPGPHKLLHADMQRRFPTLPVAYVRMAASSPHPPAQFRDVPGLPGKHDPLVDPHHYPLADVIAMLRQAHDGVRLGEGDPRQQRALRDKLTRLTTHLASRWESVDVTGFALALQRAASDLILLARVKALPMPRLEVRRKKLEAVLAGHPDQQQPGGRVRFIQASFVSSTHTIALLGDGSFYIVYNEGHNLGFSKYHLVDNQLHLERPDGSRYGDCAQLAADWTSLTWQEYPGEKFVRRDPPAAVARVVAKEERGQQ